MHLKYKWNDKTWLWSEWKLYTINQFDTYYRPTLDGDIWFFEDEIPMPLGHFGPSFKAQTLIKTLSSNTHTTTHRSTHKHTQIQAKLPYNPVVISRVDCCILGSHKLPSSVICHHWRPRNPMHFLLIIRILCASDSQWSCVLLECE